MIAFLVSLVITAQCYAGSITLYEDMSYKVIANSAKESCIEQHGATVQITEVTHRQGYNRIRTRYYSGGDFPESILTVITFDYAQNPQ